MNKNLSRLLATVLVAAMLIYTMPLIMSAVRAQPPAPSMYIVPATESFNTGTTSVGATFTVALWGSTPAVDQNGLQTFAWSAELSFNATMLQCLSVTLTNGSTSQLFSGQTTTGLSKIINNTAGTVYCGESLTSDESVGAMTASLVDIKFNITAAPAPGKTLTCNIDPGYGTAPSVDETYFLDVLPSFAEETPLSTEPCAYSYQNVVFTDVAVTNVVCSKTVIGQGLSANVTVTVANQGNSIETFNVTAYANATTYIASQNVTMSSGTSTNMTLVWNVLTGFAKGNYTISAYALPVPGETNTSNNNFTDGWVIVSIPGDIAGKNGWPDGKVDMKDIATVAAAFGSTPSSANWNPNADFNNDGRVDMKDIAIAAANFGQHYP